MSAFLSFIEQLLKPTPLDCASCQTREPDHSLQRSQIAVPSRIVILRLIIQKDGGLVGFTDTQPSMLPGISWKRNVRSKF